MEEVKNVISRFEDIRKSNSKAFEVCSEEKIAADSEYGALYQAFWQADLRMADAIDLLKKAEQKVTYKQMPAFEEVVRYGCNKKRI